MPSRTRFNPTANGPIHLGHAYMALVNQAEAHITHGSFLLRLEDDQDYWAWKNGPEKTREYCENIVRDLDWLGIVPDRITLQSQTHEQLQGALDIFLRGRELRDLAFRLQFRAPEVHGMYDYVFYPYAPYLTIHKALEDAIDSINLLIRGIDLLSENAFYEYVCEILGVFPPRAVYMPRMVLPDGQQFAQLSKTEGTGRIEDYRTKGYHPDDVLELLRKSCLIDHSGPWLIQNVKDKPVWIG